jgi:hypothetical protein
MPTEPPTVLLVTSNGTGLGHLARMVALARAAGSGDGGAYRAVLLSMSQALPLVAASTGLPAEYCPGPMRHWMPVHRWHAYLADRLVALAGETGARVLVFDGVSPYPGVLAARRRLPDVAFVWSRRGMWQPRASRAPLRAASSFDVVLEPGDLAGPADRGVTARRTDARRLAPVTLLETERAYTLDRDAARADLGLDPTARVVLVGLGAGDLDDPSERTTAVVRAALAREGWQVALLQSPLRGSRVPDDMAGRVTVLDRRFPLVRWQSAFDAAVSSAGYNTVHELVLGGVPTLLVPSAVTSADDQVGRATYLATSGLSLVADAGDPAALVAGVGRLLDDGRRHALAAAAAALPPPTGAGEAASVVAGLAGAAGPWSLPLDPWRVQRAAATAVRRVVGERRWEQARRAAGGAARPAGSAPAAGPPVVTEDLPVVTDRPDARVEQLLAGSSAAYAQERMAIARRAYGDGGGQP